MSKTAVNVALILLLVVIAASCTKEIAPQPDPVAAPTVPPRFCLRKPTLDTDSTTQPPAYVLPADAMLTEQPDVNCFAWQEFIALNWKADPSYRGRPDKTASAGEFGAPGSGPVVWETFKNTEELFLKNAETPSPWNQAPDIEQLCGQGHGLDVKPGVHHKMLVLTAKFHDDMDDQQILDQIDEAGVKPPAWLTAQNKRLVHYEVLVNEDYFNYVVDDNNKFYDAREQWKAVKKDGPGIVFPVGPSRYGPTGAIELKAGWLEIEPAQYDRYLTSSAVIVNDGRCRQAVVGLIGLHIVHKTMSMPNWTWATFEHVDNAPDRLQVEQGELKSSYTFFDGEHCPLGAVCRPTLDADGGNPAYDPACPLQCAQNRKPEKGDPTDRPIQVVREVPIPGYVQNLNKQVWGLLSSSSVFRNYQLVNTLWPQSGEEVEPGSQIPITQGGAAPTTGLSNVSAETYAQNLTCLDCHQFAPIACSSGTGKNPTLASDYTFQLSKATQPDPPEDCSGD